MINILVFSSTWTSIIFHFGSALTAIPQCSAQQYGKYFSFGSVFLHLLQVNGSTFLFFMSTPRTSHVRVLYILYSSFFAVITISTFNHLIYTSYICLYYIYNRMDYHIYNNNHFHNIDIYVSLILSYSKLLSYTG